MSPLERFSKLKSKKLCTKCIFPGAIKCFFLHYCCPNPSHENGEKVHVLLCSKHENGDENLKLLEKFKVKFIKNCNVQLAI